MDVLASPGHPWHYEPRDVIQGDHCMSIDELLHLSTLLLPAVVMWWRHVHLRETERGRQQSVHMQTEVLALRAGETVVGVIDRSQGPAVFLVHDATHGRDDA
jgi:hypothetical protein